MTLNQRPGWNPTRRNKHVGTKAHGHSTNNRMCIPESWHVSTCYYEQLCNYHMVTRRIAEREIRFFIEPTRPDWFYPCTVDDICAVLSHCDAQALAAFDFIVMRQPTKKQHVLCPVYGRAIFTFDIDKFTGAAIVIEAQNLGVIKLTKSKKPEGMRELNRLQEDGHTIQYTRRWIEIHPSIQSLRNTVLYRTLLHEIGHHLDFGRSSSTEWDSKTKTTKEDFAHRYAHECSNTLRGQGAIPFAPIHNEDSMHADGLKPEWFSEPQ